MSDPRTNRVEPGRYSGIIRLLAEAIADKIIEDEKQSLRVSKNPEAAPEPPNPPPVQGKRKEGGSLAAEAPRPTPPA